MQIRPRESMKRTSASLGKTIASDRVRCNGIYARLERLHPSAKTILRHGHLSVTIRLSTPQPLYGFPGLNPGDRWCLCVDRWKEAEANGVAPPVVLAATHASVEKHISIERLKRYASAEEDTV